jgi:hypothetical protein
MTHWHTRIGAFSFPDCPGRRERCPYPEHLLSGGRRRERRQGLDADAMGRAALRVELCRVVGRERHRDRHDERLVTEQSIAVCGTAFARAGGTYSTSKMIPGGGSCTISIRFSPNRSDAVQRHSDGDRRQHGLGAVERTGR